MPETTSRTSTTNAHRTAARESVSAVAVASALPPADPTGDPDKASRRERRRRIVFIAHPSGAMWKTQTAIGLIDYLRRSGVVVVPVAIDSKAHLGLVVPDAIAIRLATAAEIERSETADAEKLDALLEAVLATPPGATLVVDCGANTIERLSFFCGAADLADDVADAEIVLLVPIRNAAGAVRGAVETRRLLEAQFDRVRVVPVLCGEDCVERLAGDELALYERHFAPLVAAGEVLVHPNASKRALDVMARELKPAAVLGAIDDDEKVAAWAPAAKRAVVRQIRGMLSSYAAALEQQLERIFGNGEAGAPR
jgi:hypothetical protein